MPTGDAPTTSELSTILLPTKVRLILDVLRYLSMSQTQCWFTWHIEAGWCIHTLVHCIIIASGNGLSHVWCQAITRTSDDLLSVRLLRNKFQWNLNKNMKIFFQEIAFENVICHFFSASVCQQAGTILVPVLLYVYISLYPLSSARLEPCHLITRKHFFHIISMI